MNTKKLRIKNLTASGVCLALCMVLPWLTGQIPHVGQVLGPMHIPVLLCGFIAGPFYAASVGFIAPLLRYALFQMPPFVPVLPFFPVPPGVAMMFELAAYGLVCGVLYRRLSSNVLNVYISLILAMLVGRFVWGAAMLVISPMYDSTFSWAAFMAAAFVTAAPGIILHIVLIPVIVIALKKANFIAGHARA